MAPPVVAGRSFIPGLRSEFLGTYRRMYESQREILALVMTLDLPSTRRTEFYFFWQSAPHMVRWAYGESIPEDSFKGVRFNVTNVRWGKKISWEADDRSDDQTNSLLEQARDLGRSAALLDERVLIQIMLNTSDADLLTDLGADPGNEDTKGGIPNAPDGQQLFSTTNDGSAARFGVTGGNIVTGTGVSGGVTDLTMRADYFTARERFALMQDTQGQPLFGAGLVKSKAVMMFAASNWSVWAQAFQRSIIPDQAGGAGVSNEVEAANLTPIPYPTQRLTSDDFYVGIDGPRNKAVFSQNREPISEVIATRDNSDTARNQDQEYIRFKLRKGFGVTEPYSFVFVNEAA